jgi:NDP-sugar pyrophosphorylase family protein
MREKERLGTAGSLRMMRRETNRDLLVCNADLLTTFAFDRVVHKHEKSGADITAVVRTHVHSVPYGVVDVDGERIVGMREKPEVSFLINAGIYVVKHSVLDHIADGESIDMPDLIRRVLESGGSIKPFPMHEFWLDVGKPEDFLKANEEIATLFDREAGVR